MECVHHGGCAFFFFAFVCVCLFNTFFPSIVSVGHQGASVSFSSDSWTTVAITTLVSFPVWQLAAVEGKLALSIVSPTSCPLKLIQGRTCPEWRERLKAIKFVFRMS